MLVTVEPRRVRIAALVVLLAALAAAAGAETLPPWRIAAVTPAAPSWGEKVTVTVTGSEAPGCGPLLSQPRISNIDGVFFFVDLRVTLDCTLPYGPYHPFDAELDLGYLEPGLYKIRLDTGAAPVDVRDFEVYDIGTAAVELPEVVTDAVPGALSVTHAPEAALAGLHVEGSVVTVELARPPAPWLPVATLQVPLPALPPGDYELRVVAPGLWTSRSIVRRSFPVWSAGGCLPDERTLCLDGGRFRVRGSWQDFAGNAGVAHPVTDGRSAEDDSGLLWFFGADNAEITIKVLDGCALGGHWWVFLASGSTVAYEIEVVDTTSGARQVYANRGGDQPPLVADTSAFSCGP